MGESEAAARPVMVVGALAVELAGARSAIESRKMLALGRARAWAGIARPAGAGLPPRSALAATIGMGQRAVEASLARLFEDFPPAAVALVGLAGGCAPDARAGDAILCDPVIVEPPAGPNGIPIAGREPIAADPLARDAAIRAAGACGARIRVGPSVTVNVVASASAKESLGRNRGALVCEMENFWVARFCQARGVPFAALRVVFDGVEDPLPDAPGLGERALWRVLAERPRLVASLPRLALRMLRVRRTLDPLARALVRELAAAAPE
jgi:nucleoside phosphorylase